MNCPDSKTLLQAERDGALTDRQRADLARHLADCAGCREFRVNLAAVSEFVRSDAAGVAVPDPATEWQRLQARLNSEEVRLPRKRRLAPIYWLSAPLAAAAAIALTFLALQQPPPSSPTGTESLPAGTPLVASAEFVEVHNRDATPMVYVDQESGWLVVWAVAAIDTKTDPKG